MREPPAGNSSAVIASLEFRTAGGEDLVDVRSRNGLAEIKSLQLVAARGSDRLSLIERLDAFRDGADLHLLTEPGDRLYDRLAVLSLPDVEIAHEAAIDLDFVEGEASQVAQRRIGRPEVIKRDAHAECAQIVQNRARVDFVAQERAFGNLELGPMRREP